MRVRNDLITVHAEMLEENGTFLVTVSNAASRDVTGTIGIESNVPLLFTHGGRVLNHLSRPQDAVQTGRKTVGSNSQEEFVFHWTDPDGDLKWISIRAAFKTARSGWIGTF